MKELLLPSDVSFLPLKLLKAGDISCYYEAGNLRYIRCGDTELVRMIYGAVRDENWDTLPMVITNESVQNTADGFSISYQANYRFGAIDYKATMQIEGYKNTLRFSMEGEALSSFKKNRIGLCVLHPLSCIGLKVKIIQPGGGIVESTFPRLISPHQPFTEISSMEWTTTHGVPAVLKFEGEVFETEDQRNWTDASFKTYSTPLKFPIPALVKAGDKVAHTITLSVEQPNQDRPAAQVVHREEKVRFPAIGYCRREGAVRLSESQAKRLRMIPFNHIRVVIRLYKNNWMDELSAAVEEAEMMKATLHLVAHVDERYQQQTQKLVQALPPIQSFIASLLLLRKGEAVTPAAVPDHFYAVIKKSLTSILVGYGTDGHFADLNRNRPHGVDYDFLAFSLHPQAHATDSRTILENLESQRYNLETLQSFADGRPLHVSPITFGKISHADDAVNSADERQHTAFGAFWTAMAIQCLADASVLNFYAMTGKYGLLIEEPEPSPVYDLLRKIREFNPKWVIRRFNNDELLMDGLLLENQTGDRLLVCSDIKLVGS
jgi:D-apionolactonase